MDCPFLKGKPEQDNIEDFKVCLNCSYPRCVYDYQKGYTVRKENKAKRNAQIKKLKEQGKSAVELAKEFNLSKRAIHWIIKECNK